MGVTLGGEGGICGEKATFSLGVTLLVIEGGITDKKSHES